jgi:hypothetical protein
MCLRITRGPRHAVWVPLVCIIHHFWACNFKRKDKMKECYDKLYWKAETFQTPNNDVQCFIKKKKHFLCKNKLRDFSTNQCTAHISLWQRGFVCFERLTKADALCGLFLMASTLILSQNPRAGLPNLDLHLIDQMGLTWTSGYIDVSHPHSCFASLQKCAYSI